MVFAALEIVMLRLSSWFSFDSGFPLTWFKLRAGFVSTFRPYCAWIQPTDSQECSL